MKPLTYYDLLVALKELTEDQLDMSVSVLIDGELYGITDTIISSELPVSLQLEICDVVGETQPLLVS